jgi:ArsR family transcriptional regulator, zinc-responsive transcriptional repressor
MSDFPPESITAATQGLRGIAHEIRLTVLCHLLNGPMCVTDLIEATGASQSNLSQHLSKMRMMGILRTHKQGQHVYYQIAEPAFANLVQSLKRIYCPEACEK